MLQGYREKLTKDDRFLLSDEDKSGAIVKYFQNVWNKERNDIRNTYKTSSTEEKVGNLQPNLVKCLTKAFGPYILIGALFEICSNIMTLCTPYILK